MSESKMIRLSDVKESPEELLEKAIADTLFEGRKDISYFAHHLNHIVGTLAHGDDRDRYREFRNLLGALGVIETYCERLARRSGLEQES